MYILAKRGAGGGDDWRDGDLAGLVGLANMTSANEPSDVSAHKGPPVAFCCERVSRVEAVVPNIVVRRYHRRYSLALVENPLVGALRVVLPEDIVVDKETRGVANDESILMVGSVVGALEGDEPVVCCR